MVDIFDDWKAAQYSFYWMRHTGQWWPVHKRETLSESLRLLETEGPFNPKQTQS
jgi:hypothetical protein